MANMQSGTEHRRFFTGAFVASYGDGDPVARGFTPAEADAINRRMQAHVRESEAARGAARLPPRPCRRSDSLARASIAPRVGPAPAPRPQATTAPNHH